MKLLSHLFSRLHWLSGTLVFLKTNFKMVLGLGLVAAFGRVIQLGGFGEIERWMNVVLEIAIESARLLLVLYVLGLASVKAGTIRVWRFIRHKDDRKQHWLMALQKIKKEWRVIALNVATFLAISFCINYLIELLAYETCLYLTLKRDGILAGSSSEWTILLFFKNLSVIPFTLVFETFFLLWLTNKFQGRPK